eukprot:TRINITY_DN163_c0_g2_i2.p1 TRINITY_DN163_c0_g2~~TRINITY_DN163_c0_g2_i2.p1  ORF type:complete len:486 (-),score=118.59 TRINITY_DN163_c0_g2_i2:835-2292(-)
MSDPSRGLVPIDLADLAPHTNSPPPAPLGERRAPQKADPANASVLQSLKSTEMLLASLAGDSGKPPEFIPLEPDRLESLGISAEEVERLILKYLLARGSNEGRWIARSLCLPFGLLAPVFADLKALQLVAYRNATSMGDYEYILTDLGRERARRYTEECTYFGAAPVSLKDYVDSVKAQTITRHRTTAADLKRAFSDLILNDSMLRRLGPAINSGRGMFLFGPAGNGKTSIAERVTSCFGTTIYIPKAISVDGDIIRIFDPVVHERIDESPTHSGLINDSKVDSRWVKIRRPTVIAGGELTMEELEIRQNQATKICESPIQIKSNCGTLVIDDFGRQRMPVVELLNRWIVPLEKRYDFLSVPCGKRIQVPFDQLIVFATNLEPRDLVDAAFLRRIPYKIPVPDPSLDEFHKLFALMASQLGFTYEKRAVEYLLAKHYVPVQRPLRACQPRDILLQVKYFCQYNDLPIRLTPEAIDFACETYFSVM